MKKDKYSGSEVGRILGIPRRTATHYLQKGVIPGKQHPLTGSWSVEREELIAFMKEKGMDPSEIEVSTKIFVVDDDPDIIAFFERIVKKFPEDVRFEFFSNGYEAMLRLGDVVPDLMILDIMMEGMDGKQVFKAIKRSEKTRAVKVLAISGYLEQLESMIELGVDESMLKPFDAKDILEKIERLI